MIASALRLAEAQVASLADAAVALVAGLQTRAPAPAPAGAGAPNERDPLVDDLKLYKTVSFVCIAVFLAQIAYSLVSFVLFVPHSCDADADADADTDHYLIALLIKALLLAALGKVTFTAALFLLAETKLARAAAQRTGSHFKYVDYLLSRVDYLFSRSNHFKILGLGSATALFIAFGAILFSVLSGIPFVEAVWMSWTFIADPGTHAGMSSGSKRLISLGLTLGGMVLFALVIGIVSDDVSAFVDNLRQGKSKVIESGHTLILGQNDKLIPIIIELCEANESEGGGLIVILTTLPKADLEETLNHAHFDYKGTTVIVRTGSPYKENDLLRVSAINAKAVIVLSNPDAPDPNTSDVESVRIILSLRSIKIAGHITCEVSDQENDDLFNLISDGKVETVVSSDIIGRLMVQCSNSPGLAEVLEDILGFYGNEFYISPWPALVGCSFAALMYRFDAAIPVGIVKRQGDSTQIMLNPTDDTILMEGDEVIVIAEDNDSYSPTAAPIVQLDMDHLMSISSTKSAKVAKPENLLFIGWRRGIHDMIEQVNSRVVPGSTLTLFSEIPVDEQAAILTTSFANMQSSLSDNAMSNIRVKHIAGNPTMRRDLEALDIYSFDSILVLADQARTSFNVVESDSRSLTSLLLIRDIQTKQREKAVGAGMAVPEKTCLISEILDNKTRSLVAVTSAGDYIASNALVSKAISMVAEQREVNGVLRELFSARGNKITLQKSSDFISPDVLASFYEMQYIGRQIGQLIVGYRTSEGEISVNPSNPGEKRYWRFGLDFIVICKVNGK